MHRLSEASQLKLRKANTKRLQMHMVNYEVTEEHFINLFQEQLLEFVAKEQLKIEGVEKSKAMRVTETIFKAE